MPVYLSRPTYFISSVTKYSRIVQLPCSTQVYIVIGVTTLHVNLVSQEEVVLSINWSVHIHHVLSTRDHLFIKVISVPGLQRVQQPWEQASRECCLLTRLWALRLQISTVLGGVRWQEVLLPSRCNLWAGG